MELKLGRRELLKGSAALAGLVLLPGRGRSEEYALPSGTRWHALVKLLDCFFDRIIGFQKPEKFQQFINLKYVRF